MAKLTFLGLAEKILNEDKRPLSPAEMWKIAVAKEFVSLLDSEGKTPAVTLYSAIYTDARDNPDSIFIKIGARPARYFLKSLAQSARPAELEKAASAEAALPELYDYDEADLHPFLAYYAKMYFKAYTKTIKHNTSRKKEFGEWVHPDVIGVYYPVEDWRSEVLDLSAATGNIAVKLYSFEIKKSLSFSNLREAYFQAVSNSSWAHEGYLVAADISSDEDFRAELRRLSAAFGIGVIELGLDDPDSSEVLFPAHERDALDWDTLNKLTMNKDVQELLTRIKNDLQTKEVIREKYDRVLSREELAKSIKRKKVGC
ncbi:MAG: hypothetical protein HY674_07555 [Chloroflexi bacterium]|nr:hypothetical protein [Chloroflexota bacterium]